MSGKTLQLQWGPRDAEFRLSYANHWVYRFGDMYLQLDRDVERGKGTYALGEWSAHCTPYVQGAATAQAALDALHARVTARRDELSNFLAGAEVEHEIWEFDCLGEDPDPYLVGTAMAGSFNEAVDKYHESHPQWIPCMRRLRLTREQADERKRKA